MEKRPLDAAASQEGPLSFKNPPHARVLRFTQGPPFVHAIVMKRFNTDDSFKRRSSFGPPRFT